MRPCGNGLPSFDRLTQTVADRSSWNSSPNARAMDVAPGRLAIIGANAGGYRGRQMRPLAEVWRQPVPATDTLLGRAAAAVARQADDATTHGLAGQPRGLSCCDCPDRPSPPTWTRVLRQRGNEKRRNRRRQRQRQRRAGRIDQESWRQEQSQLRASGQDRGCCHGLRTGRANLGRIATVSLPMFMHPNAFSRSEPACLNPFAAGQMWTHQSL